MRSDNINIGRPYGGVAIIYRSNINCNVKVIETISNRLLLCYVEYKDYNSIILCNVYMPTNTTSNNYEFNEILLEVTSVMQIYSGCDIIFTGDFNCNMNSNDVRTSFFKEFLEINELNYPTIYDDSNSRSQK